MITQTNFMALIKEGMAIRTSYTTLRAAYKFLARVEQEEGIEGFERLNLDQEFISGVICINSTFSLSVWSSVLMKISYLSYLHVHSSSLNSLVSTVTENLLYLVSSSVQNGRFSLYHQLTTHPISCRASPFRYIQHQQYINQSPISSSSPTTLSYHHKFHSPM